MALPILGMFDKIDDIVYEPVKAISGWISAPLKHFEHKREMKTREQESQIQKEMMDKQAELAEAAKEHDFAIHEKEEKLQMEKAAEEQRLSLEKTAEEQRLDLAKNREVAKIDADVRRWNAEIDQMINENEDARRDKLVESIKNYQLTLAQAAIDIGNQIGTMSLELRERAQEFVLTKTKQYKELQQEVRDDADKRLLEIEEKYANNERIRIRMEDSVINGMDVMIDNANSFIKELSEDIKRLNQNIDDIVNSSIKNTNEYLKPMTAGLAIETEAFDSQSYIESKNRALLEGGEQ